MGSSTLCECLEWDTEFFGRRIAKVLPHSLTAASVEEVLRSSEEQKIQCLYFLCDCADGESIRLAERSGFHLVDVRVTLERAVCATEDWGVEVSGIRLAHEADIQMLRVIARASHTDTRFFSDANFDREHSRALYETWIDKSCRGYADAVLVASSDGNPIGYITCQLLNQSEGSIGLVAVSPEAHGSGWGRRLVSASLRWFSSKDVASVSVATQGRNIRAQRLYQWMGFVTKSVQLWYHRWSRPNE